MNLREEKESIWLKWWGKIQNNLQIIMICCVLITHNVTFEPFGIWLSNTYNYLCVNNNSVLRKQCRNYRSTHLLCMSSWPLRYLRTHNHYYVYLIYVILVVQRVLCRYTLCQYERCSGVHLSLHRFIHITLNPRIPWTYIWKNEADKKRMHMHIAQSKRTPLAIAQWFIHL